MLLIKDGVTPRSFYILAAIANTAMSMGMEVTITAGTNGTHMKNSLHYADKAVDVRSKNFVGLETKKDFLAAVLIRLGRDYQGILESVGTDNEHFHFEYDPKISGVVNA